MKKQLFYLSTMAVLFLSACSGDNDNDTIPTNQTPDRIIGTWESWKEVTDSGQTFQLIENGCAKYVDIYNADGTGSEKYFSSWTDCSLLTSDNNIWQSLGNDNYKISMPNGSFSATHHFEFVDDNTHIQRDEQNDSDIYFRRKQ